MTPSRPDYRAMTDAELADCAAAIEAVRRDRRTIATETEYVNIHEQAAADSLAAADRIRADAAAARTRQNTPPDFHDIEQEES